MSKDEMAPKLATRQYRARMDTDDRDRTTGNRANEAVTVLAVVLLVLLALGTLFLLG